MGSQTSPSESHWILKRSHEIWTFESPKHLWGILPSGFSETVRMDPLLSCVSDFVDIVEMIQFIAFVDVTRCQTILTGISGLIKESLRINSMCDEMKRPPSMNLRFISPFCQPMEEVIIFHDPAPHSDPIGRILYLNLKNLIKKHQRIPPPMIVKDRNECGTTFKCPLPIHEGSHHRW